MNVQRIARALRALRAGLPGAMMLAALLFCAPERGWAGTIAVTYPNGGETFYFGNTITVRWTAVGVAGEVEVEYTDNGGERWRSIERVSASTGSLSWRIPHRPGTNALVRVRARDGSASDQSDNTFEMTEDPTQIPLVKSPNGGEIWTEGEKHMITWQAPADAAQVILEYSANGGGVWTSIATVAAAQLQYEWTVPHVADAPVSSMFVRMTISDAPDEFDQSDATFTVKPKTVVTPPADTTNVDTTNVDGPEITLLYPNGGERLKEDSLIAIRWRERAPTGEVEITYSADGGGTWHGVGKVAAGIGSYPWKVPGDASDVALVRLVMHGGSATDISDRIFHITKKDGITPPVDEVAAAVLLPNGGEHWSEGDRAAITWAMPLDVERVVIELSTDRGASWMMIDTAAARPARYEWTVPHLSDLPIADALVRVTDVAESDHTDLSDASFTIAPFVVASAPDAIAPVTIAGARIYPNPARAGVTLEWPQRLPGRSAVRLYDDRGALVRDVDAGMRESGTQRIGIDVSALPAGLYLYEVEMPGMLLRGTVTVVR